MDQDQGPSRSVEVDLSEGFGERLLGQLLDRAHKMPPQLIIPLVGEELARIGGRDLAIYLQDYEQMMLAPLPGRGLVVDEAKPIDGSREGEAFLSKRVIEDRVADGVRMYLPLLDGSDEVGVMVLTLDRVEEADRRLLGRLAGLVADMMVTKSHYTDQFFKVRRRGKPLTVAAEIQWSLLPPLSMNTPQVSLAGVLEPAHEIAGDSLDYALNDNILHLAIIDAMGHELNAAVLATVAIGAYRHARRADVGLAELYSSMDKAIDAQFGPDQFVTAQMLRLDVETGQLQWVNAGHPAPLLIRGHRVIQRLESPPTSTGPLSAHPAPLPWVRRTRAAQGVKQYFLAGAPRDVPEHRPRDLCQGLAGLIACVGCPAGPLRPHVTDSEVEPLIPDRP